MGTPAHPPLTLFLLLTFLCAILSAWSYRQRNNFKESVYAILPATTAMNAYARGLQKLSDDMFSLVPKCHCVCNFQETAQNELMFGSMSSEITYGLLVTGKNKHTHTHTQKKTLHFRRFCFCRNNAYTDTSKIKLVQTESKLISVLIWSGRTRCWRYVLRWFPQS